MGEKTPEHLYVEASRISDTYATGLYASETDLETVKEQLDSLAVYLDSSIRIINPSGRLVLDTDRQYELQVKGLFHVFRTSNLYPTPQMVLIFQLAWSAAPAPSAPNEKCVQYTDLSVNLTNYSVLYKGRTIDMPPKELELLYFLASSPIRIFCFVAM